MSSDAEIAIGIVQVMKQFDWSRIALVTQSENIFTFVSVKPFTLAIVVCVHYANEIKF